ncbi:hypothetical protein CF319_g8986 [Tilletia indica]|nr:hypothetical protein CF319_g8986 [Tilletia indica]
MIPGDASGCWVESLWRSSTMLCLLESWMKSARGTGLEAAAAEVEAIVQPEDTGTMIVINATPIVNQLAAAAIAYGLALHGSLRWRLRPHASCREGRPRLLSSSLRLHQYGRAPNQVHRFVPNSGWHCAYMIKATANMLWYQGWEKETKVGTSAGCVAATFASPNVTTEVKPVRFTARHCLRVSPESTSAPTPGTSPSRPFAAVMSALTARPTPTRLFTVSYLPSTAVQTAMLRGATFETAEDLLLPDGTPLPLVSRLPAVILHKCGAASGDVET